MKRTRVGLGLLLAFLVHTSHADTINFTVENLGGNSWQYNYTVENTGTNTIGLFSVLFDLFLYENLAVTASPADWDSIVFQPDPGLPDDGIFDTLALGLGIAPGAMQGGFSVSFDFLGTGTPGEQFFDIFDSDFRIVFSGETTAIDSVPVPEPTSLALFAVGLLLVTTLTRRRRGAFRPRLE